MKHRTAATVSNDPKPPKKYQKICAETTRKYDQLHSFPAGQSYRMSGGTDFGEPVGPRRCDDVLAVLESARRHLAVQARPGRNPEPLRDLFGAE